MRQVEQTLIVGIGMDGGHGAAVDAESVLNDFGDGREAVRGARRVGNDVMLRRVIGLVVYTKNKSGVGAIGRRGDDDFLHRSAEMFLRVGAFGEKAGGFHDDFRANRGPIELGGILHAKNLEALSFHGDAVVRVSDLVGQIAQHGIILQQMRERFCVRNVIHRDKLDVLVVDSRAHDVASDAAEAVDPDLDGHTFLR